MYLTLEYLAVVLGYKFQIQHQEHLPIFALGKVLWLAIKGQISGGFTIYEQKSAYHKEC